MKYGDWMFVLYFSLIIVFHLNDLLLILCACIYTLHLQALDL